MTEERKGAAFKYSIKADSGFRSNMEGRLRGPEHHGVVTAACDGLLVDNLSLLYAAPELLSLMKEVLSDLEIGAHPHLHIYEMQDLIAKAEGR